MRVTLTQPHTHAGRKYPAGAVLDLPDHKAAWLIGLTVAEPAHADSGAATKAKPVKEH